jgi:hypothetical protein
VVDQTTGELSSAAFEIAPDNADLSVNWLEFLHATDRDAALAAVRKCFAEKPYKIKPSGRFAIMNVAASVHALRAVAEAIPPRLEHQPLQKPADPHNDPSHAEYKGIPLAAAKVAGLLLLEQVIDKCPGA